MKRTILFLLSVSLIGFCQAQTVSDSSFYLKYSDSKQRITVDSGYNLEWEEFTQIPHGGAVCEEKATGKTKSVKLSEKDIQGLVSVINKMNFMSIDPNEGGCFDCCTTDLEVRLNGKTNALHRRDWPFREITETLEAFVQKV